MVDKKKKKRKIELTPRQKAFADYYLESGIKEEAAIKAGYSRSYAAKLSYKLLENVGIKQYIKERSEKPTNDRIASADEVLEFYTKGMRGEVKDQFGLEASLADRIKCADAMAKRYGLTSKDTDQQGLGPLMVNVVYGKPPSLGADDSG